MKEIVMKCFEHIITLKKENQSSKDRTEVRTDRNKESPEDQLEIFYKSMNHKRNHEINITFGEFTVGNKRVA